MCVFMDFKSLTFSPLLSFFLAVYAVLLLLCFALGCMTRQLSLIGFFCALPSRDSETLRVSVCVGWIKGDVKAFFS